MSQSLSSVASPTARMPVVFLPHGGGPWPFMNPSIGSDTELAALSAYLRSLATLRATPPRAIVMISAHWEASVATVQTAPAPSLLYDYFGFPPQTYQVKWPAPGAPDVAARVRELLAAAGIASASDATRGFDHGTFVPLSLPYPNGEIPTLQLSLLAGLDPAAHLQLGRALAPLRDEGILIVGSGMTFHNLRAFGDPRAIPTAETFDTWLRTTMSQSAAARDAALVAWAQAPAARQAHPREEHLLPLMVCAGAAGSDAATLAYDGTILGLRLSAFHFG